MRMEDVARLAGVSAITVSRALRHPEKVANETRDRITSAIRTLGYVPNLTAASLASNRSGIIAAIIPTVTNSIFADTVQGMSDRLRREGYQLLLGNTGYSVEEESALVSAFLARRPDGIILTGARHTPTTREMLADANLPVVETWDLAVEPIDMMVGFSNFEAAHAWQSAATARSASCPAAPASTTARPPGAMATGRRWRRSAYPAIRA
jgi:LacI family gluconate utilization system Gnt-I transcriptional repressor